MRTVRRRITAKHPVRRSTDYVADREFDTLTRRFRALKEGESLYPWANTVLHIDSGKRRWLAKQPGEH